MNDEEQVYDYNTHGINRMTSNARKLIANGYDIAKKFKYSEYMVIHLFFVILESKDGIVHDIFSRLNVDVETTLSRITEEFNKFSSNKKLEKLDESKTIFSSELRNLINEAFLVASSLSHVYVGAEHLLLAMFKLKNIDFIDDLVKSGIDYELIKKTLLSAGNYSLIGANSDFNKQETPLPGLPFPFQDPRGMQQPQASNFTRNMNDLSLNGSYSNITGRDKEIRRLIHILSRKTKNNPILVGDAGVGKTAIVEGFVNDIVNKKVPASLLDAKIINLDIGAILAGAKLRGDVEERITAVINSAIEDSNTIIFIDEIHNIVGAGTSGGRDSMDIANLLKPYLTSSDFSIIGATTSDEYTKYFEEDSALSRRFQPIYVEELNPEEAKKVIYNILPEFEEYHKVKIHKESVDEAVDLSSKFIKDRYLPDKAIDIIDEAAASIKIGREIALEPELNKLGEKLLKAQNAKDEALLKEDFVNAAKFKETEEEIVNDITEIIEGRKKTDRKFQKTVTVDLIKEIIVDWTKIPIAASDISDKRLKDLSPLLKNRIIGQDRVVDNVALAIQRSHLGLGGEKRPLASFLFLGPTGTGKSELAKTIARELFGSDNLLLQVNMSEFMEMHSISKLIGSPPGYVGYQEGGQLTTFVKRRPYCVVLFDEIEKSHPDTLNILLQILEDGELTDGKGNKVSFKNAVIIMTSNIGAEEISSDNKLGFDISIDEIKKDEVDVAYEEMREQMMEELRLTLRPELINRIDVIDIFRGLNRVDCLKISQLLVNEFILRMVPKGIILSVSQEVVKKINEDGYSKEYGGRNIRRKVQETLENGLATYLLHTKVSKKRKNILKISVDIKNKSVTFS